MMKWFMRLNRDPKPGDDGGGAGDPPPEPKVFSQENLPQSGKEWEELRNADPILYGDLTKKNYDSLYRQNKEKDEKLTTLENQNNNLSVELDKYKTYNPSDVPTDDPPPDDGVKKPYSIENLPKDDQEWEELFIDNPVLASDLRSQFNNSKITTANNFEEARATSQRVVQGEHPDMYLAELDNKGQPIKDDKDNIILKKDANGDPIFNPYSVKGKVWDSIYNEDPTIVNSAKAPETLMALMERQLRIKGEKVVNDAQENREKILEDGQVVHTGVTPPVDTTDLKFADENEKVRAQKMVDRKVYKDLTEYCKVRDEEPEEIYDDNRLPDFSKK